MKRYTAIIVDDEKPVLQLMRVVLGRQSRYTIEGLYANPLEALEAVGDIRPDVAFLDIEMPKLSGLELARQLTERSPRTRIVFSTAYKSYALKAFDVNAIDYILKPVTPAAIERVTSRLDQSYSAAPAAEQATKSFTIRCFGTFEVLNSARELIKWPTRKTEELLAYFLCHPDKEISKWRLADILWPHQMNEERAMNSLYNTVYRLKNVLKDQRIDMDVRKTRDGYWLDTGEINCDILAFQRIGAVIETNTTDAERSRYETLCLAYRGKLFETKEYDWKERYEAAFARQYELMVRELTAYYVAVQDWKRAERVLAALLDQEPLNEEMNGLLLDVYLRSGNAVKARQHYASFAAAFRAEFGVEPAALIEG